MLTAKSIEQKLAELRVEAEKLGLNLYAVLQDQDDLLVEANTVDQAWNDTDDAKQYACEELDLSSELYDVHIVVVKRSS